MTSILFVCTANQFRSPLAAASFAKEVKKHCVDQEISISSAGIWAYTGKHARSDAIVFGNQNGIDLNDHRSREVTESLLAQSDLILVMESGQREAIIKEFPAFRSHIYLLSEAAGFYPFDIPNPYALHIKPEIAALEIFEITTLGYAYIYDLAQKLVRNKVANEHTNPQPTKSKAQREEISQTREIVHQNDHQLYKQAIKALREDDRMMAINYLKEYIQLNPNDEKGWLLLSGLSTGKNRLIYLRRAEQLAPNDPRVLAAIVWARQK
jgi:protein-tyrosine phosphatase